MLRRQLHSLSRNRPVLVRAAAAIVGFSLLVAIAVSGARSAITVKEVARSPLTALELALTREGSTAESVAGELRDLHRLIPATGGEAVAAHGRPGLPEGLNLTTLEDFQARAPLDPSQRQLFVAYLNARYAQDELREEGRRYLESHARMRPPVRFANEFMGDVLFARNDFDASLPHYEAEAAGFESAHARGCILQILILTENAGKLRDLAPRPEFRQIASRLERIKVAILLEDWLGLLPEVIAYDYHDTGAAERLLTLAAASVWFFIVIQFGRFAWRRLVLELLGVLAGVASVTATLYVLILQENAGGMNPGADWIEQIIYFVVGVGVREEAVKIAFFALLLPLLWKRKDPLDAFLAASCVGLGFGMQENVGYYQAGETIALSRFLTANFLHLAWTGLLGLALFEMLRDPRRRWEEFLATFIGVVLVHGIYDSLLDVSELSDYSALGFVVIFAVAHRFFRKAGEMRDARAHALSPLAVFVLGTALLIGCVLNYAAWASPLPVSLVQVALAVLGVFPVAFVFINQFKAD